MDRDTSKAAEIVLLYHRLHILIMHLNTAPSSQINWKAMREYDALYDDIKGMVDDPKFGIIYPSSGRPESDLAYVLAVLFRDPALDTIGKLLSKATLLYEYFQNYVCFQYPDLASQFWEGKAVSLSSQGSGSDQGYDKQIGRETDIARRRDQLEQLITQYRKNYHELELQKARYGIDVPLHITNTMRDTEKEIERLEQEFKSLC